MVAIFRPLEVPTKSSSTKVLGVLGIKNNTPAACDCYADACAYCASVCNRCFGACICHLAVCRRAHDIVYVDSAVAAAAGTPHDYAAVLIAFQRGTVATVHRANARIAACV